MVLVASSAQDSVPLPKVQLAEYTPQQVFRHILVIDKSQRLSFLPALEALRYLLENAAALVIVYLHLGIAGELEGIGAEGGKSVALEDLGQTAAHRIVNIHDIAFPLLVRQADESPATVHRETEIGIVVYGLSPLVDTAGLDCQIYLLVGLVIQMTHGTQPYRYDKAVYTLLIVVTDICYLLLIRL